METETKPKKAKIWLKRIGLAGFLFFFVKGLVWIALFIWAGKCFVEG